MWYLVCICWIQSKALPFLTKKKLYTSIKGQSTNCDRSTKSRPPLPTNPVPHNSTFLLILTDTNSKIPLEYRIIASPPCKSIFLDEFLTLPTLTTMPCHPLPLPHLHLYSIFCLNLITIKKSANDFMKTKTHAVFLTFYHHESWTCFLVKTYNNPMATF